MALRGSYLTIREVAERMGVSTSYVARLIHAGRLTGTRVGQVHLVDPESVRRFKRRPRGRPRKATPATAKPGARPSRKGAKA